MKILVPATTANLGSGFDILGAALNLYNVLTFEKSNKTTLKIINNLNDELILEPKNNLIYQSIEYFFNSIGEKTPDVKIEIEINIPFSRGLGSSSSAIAGGLFIANKLSEHNLSKNDLVTMATAIEGHPDNVAPCILGGMVLSLTEGKTVFTQNIPLKNELSFVVAIPNFKLSTEDARKVIPKQIDFSDAVFNSGRLAFLIQALNSNKFDFLNIAMQDKLHEQYRAKLIKGFYEVKESAIRNGALASVLSGAGPTILALCTNNQKEIGEAMVKTWFDLGVDAEYKILEIDFLGVREARNSLDYPLH